MFDSEEVGDEDSATVQVQPGAAFQPLDAAALMRNAPCSPAEVATQRVCPGLDEFYSNFRSLGSYIYEHAGSFMEGDPMAGLLTKEGGTELDGTEGSGSSGSGQEGPRDAPPGAMSGFEEDMDIGCDDGFGDGDDGDDGEGFGFDMGAGDGYDAFDTGVDEGGGFEGFGGSGEGSQAADPAAHAVDVLLRENLGDARGRGALGDSDTAWFGPDVVGSMEEWRRFGWSRGGAGGAGSSSNGKRSKRKEPFMIDFSAPPVPVDRLAPPPRNPKSTHLSDAAITKALSVGEAKFTLPPDTEYEVRRTAQCHTTGAIPLFACGYAFAVLIRLPQPTSLLELFLRPQRLVFRGTKETVEQTGTVLTCHGVPAAALTSALGCVLSRLLCVQGACMRRLMGLRVSTSMHPSAATAS